MNLSNVKKIYLNGSEVKQIKSGQTVLWSGQDSNWQTLFEGTKILSIKGGSSPVISGNETNFVYSITDTGYTPKLRITYTISTPNVSSTYTKKFYDNGSQVNTTPASPYEVIVGSMSSLLPQKELLGARIYNTSTTNNSITARLYVTKDTTNNRLGFNLSAAKGSSGGTSTSYTIVLTITKIEQYIGQ